MKEKKIDGPNYGTQERGKEEITISITEGDEKLTVEKRSTDIFRRGNSIGEVVNFRSAGIKGSIKAGVGAALTIRPEILNQKGA